MKLSLISNDKSTAKDEIILSIITLICIGVGVSLIYFRPVFWIIEESAVVVSGVMLVMLAVMYVPCIIYRLMTNDKAKK